MAERRVAPERVAVPEQRAAPGPEPVGVAQRHVVPEPDEAQVRRAVADRQQESGDSEPAAAAGAARLARGDSSVWTVARVLPEPAPAPAGSVSDSVDSVSERLERVELPQREPESVQLAAPLEVCLAGLVERPELRHAVPPGEADASAPLPKSGPERDSSSRSGVPARPSQAYRDLPPRN